MRIKVRVTVISTGLFSVNLSLTDELKYARSLVLAIGFSCSDTRLVYVGEN
jgi:hypothetical protein